jgi:hypothetical protein
MRSDLLRIITRWEQSGQGEGGRDAEEAKDDQEEDSITNNEYNDGSHCPPRNIGCLDGRPARALQSRAAFLNGQTIISLILLGIGRCASDSTILASTT